MPPFKPYDDYGLGNMVRGEVGAVGPPLPAPPTLDQGGGDYGLLQMLQGEPRPDGGFGNRLALGGINMLQQLGGLPSSGQLRAAEEDMLRKNLEMRMMRAKLASELAQAGQRTSGIQPNMAQADYYQSQAGVADEQAATEKAMRPGSVFGSFAGPTGDLARDFAEAYQRRQTGNLYGEEAATEKALRLPSQLDVMAGAAQKGAGAYQNMQQGRYYGEQAGTEREMRPHSIRETKAGAFADEALAEQRKQRTEKGDQLSPGSAYGPIYDQANRTYEQAQEDIKAANAWLAQLGDEDRKTIETKSGEQELTRSYAEQVKLKALAAAFGARQEQKSLERRGRQSLGMERGDAGAADQVMVDPEELKLSAQNILEARRSLGQEVDVDTAFQNALELIQRQQ